MPRQPFFHRHQATDEPQLPSITEHLRRHLPAEGPGLLPGGEQLPDEELIQAEQGGLAWAAGAFEGALSRHFGGGTATAEQQAAALHRALIRLADRPGTPALAHVRRLFREGNARGVAGPLLDRLRRQPPRHPDRLYDALRSLLLETGYREELKLALILLSSFGHAQDADLFRLIGRHEEFTLYAAGALAQVVEDPIPEYLELTRHVSGWGKIELVELLLQDLRPEVCAFLLRHGCANTILPGYTALPIATGCRLHEALDAEAIDDDLLAGASRILSCLAMDAQGGGPDGTMWDYPEGGPATERFLTHFATRATDLWAFTTVDAIHSFAKGDQDEDAFTACGWDLPLRQRVQALCRRILERPDWQPQAEAALASDDDATFWSGVQVARRLGLPLHQILVARLEAAPFELSFWCEFLSGINESGMEEALALADRLLDLKAIATGPANEMGMGDEFQLHNCASILLQTLEAFPGKGEPLILLGLRSPVVNNRHMALNALEAWAPEQYTTALRTALRQGRDDPDTEVRKRFAEVLARAGVNGPDGS